MQHQAFKLGHVGCLDAVGGIVMSECAQHPAQRVAQFAVGFDKGFQDFFADAQIVRIVRCRHPEAQNIGA